MNAIVYPSDLTGSIKIPSSKSELHRFVIAASLAQGNSFIYNVSLNDDVKNTILAMKELGATINFKNNILSIKGFNYEKKENIFFEVKESGSTLRFLIPLMSYFINNVTIKCGKELIKRPLYSYLSLYKEKIIINNEVIKLTGFVDKTIYKVDSSQSSQFISGLLFVLPLLNHDSEIEIINGLVSVPYVLMTIKTLEKFGIKIYFQKNNIKILGNQKYKACMHHIESDYSSACYLMTLGLFHNEIDCYKMKKNSLQADSLYYKFIKNLGGNISFIKGHIITRKSILHSINIDIKNCLDLGPLLIILLVLINEKACITSTKNLEYKESNRAYAIQEELKKFNVNIDVEENKIKLNGNYHIKNPNKIISSHNDHRILMSLIIFVLCSKTTATFENIECVNKSYANFFNDLFTLNAKIKIIKNKI